MLENIRLSFQGIWAHKMRSFLTMLGIIIGIAAIISIVSTIKGTSEQIKNNLVGSGNNTVAVNLQQGDWQFVEGESGAATGAPIITDSIIKELEDVTEIESASAYHMARSYDIAYQNTVLDGASVIGTNGSYFNINGLVLREGRGFIEDDFTNFNKVAIIDDGVAENLFNGDAPIGKTIEIKGEPFKIVGIVTESDKFEPIINNMDDWYTYYGSSASGKIFISKAVWPITYSFDAPSHVIVKATSTEDMTRAGKKAADILNSYIMTDGNQEGTGLNYKSDNVLEKAKALQDVSSSTNKQLLWIASISLLVGGIGVMNIMLVSVTERTREIGLKKALGARKKAILGQFLTEAAVLTSLGGLIGVGCGIGLAYLISKIAEVPVAISVPAIIISVIFSMIIGIVFGLIPSFKASRLNPIDALRYE